MVTAKVLEEILKLYTNNHRHKNIMIIIRKLLEPGKIYLKFKKQTQMNGNIMHI